MASLSRSTTLNCTTVGERRVHPRVALDVPTILDAEFTYARGLCRNVSATGASVSVHPTMPVGTIVQVYFELPTGVAVEEPAEVVRQAGDEVGLRFVNLSAQNRLALRAYVRQQQLRGSPS
jgi:hypothetical protein